jgi:hypothetical protein
LARLENLSALFCMYFIVFLCTYVRAYKRVFLRIHAGDVQRSERQQHKHDARNHAYKMLQTNEMRRHTIGRCGQHATFCVSSPKLFTVTCMYVFIITHTCYTRTWTYSCNTYMYIYHIHIHMCVCVCMYLCMYICILHIYTY